MLAQACSLVQECKSGHEAEVQLQQCSRQGMFPLVEVTKQRWMLLSAASPTELLLALLASDALQTADVLQARRGSELEGRLASLQLTPCWFLVCFLVYL